LTYYDIGKRDKVIDVMFNLLESVKKGIDALINWKV